MSDVILPCQTSAAREFDHARRAAYRSQQKRRALAMLRERRRRRRQELAARACVGFCVLPVVGLLMLVGAR